MKFRFIFMLVSLLQVTASVYSQTATITINNQDATISDIFDAIEKQTEYTIFFKNDQLDVSRPAGINPQTITVKDALTQVLRESNNDYTLVDKTIVITPKVVRQGIAITGTITDDSGEMLPGVNVVVKGMAVGVITDIWGRYSITVPNQNTTLQFSFIGYNREEITVNDRKVIDVTMVENSLALEEVKVVAIGYGYVQRRDLTGSVSSVSGAQLKDIPVASASQAMVGRMAGVHVTQSEGSPDAEIKIRVRGGGSITQDNSPLYIVDGFPVDNINHIVPTDIHSIDVLKDASSTAIYGARGANGVVIVTTKTGTEGKAKITYNGYNGFKYNPKFLEVMSPFDYVLWMLETRSSQAQNHFGHPGDFEIYKGFKGTDWQRKILGNMGTSMNHNISVSGGSKQFKYNASMSRNEVDEIMMGSSYDATNVSLRTIYEAKSWLKIDVNARWTGTNIMGQGTGLSGDGSGPSGIVNNRFVNIIQFRPIEGLTSFIDFDDDEDTLEIDNTQTTNPLEQVENDYRRLERSILNVNGGLEFTLAPNLKYRFDYGTQSQINENKRWFGAKHSNTRYYANLPIAEIATETINSWRMANTLTYTKRDFLPCQNITVMVGEELTSRQSESITNTSRYFPEATTPSGAFSMMQYGTPDPTVTFIGAPNTTSSWFGRVNYDYRGKYLFTGVFRADGSSKFAPGNRWGYFPSAAVAWRISDETFMASTASWLSNLKLRASLGQSGNNRVADDVWKKTFSVSGDKIIFFDDETASTSFITPETSLSNRKLKWETTVTRNVALDFGLLNQRVQGTLEVYQNTTRDLLIRARVPTYTGYDTQYQNIGQTSNRGLELTLEGAIVQSRNFSLAASFNIGFNRNRVDKLGEIETMYETSGWSNVQSPGLDYIVQVGKPIGMIYGYITDGMYSFDDFDYHASTQTFVLKEGVPSNKSIVGIINDRNFKPGTVKFKYLDKEGVMTEAETTLFGDRSYPLVNESSKTVIGYAYPKHTGGFNISGQWKSIDFSAFFNWSYGNDVYNANKLAFTQFYGTRSWRNMLNIMSSDKRFMYFDPVTCEEVFDRDQLMELNKNASIWSSRHTAGNLHSWAIEDGSFLRLNTATLGYSFPKKLLTRLRLEQLRIYATGYNLWIWTNYTGYDPEVDSRRTTPLTPGVDWCAYPRNRSYHIGLNLTF